MLENEILSKHAQMFDTYYSDFGEICIREKSIKKKICFVLYSIPKYAAGGAELQGELLAHEFNKYGWKVDIIVEFSRKKEENVNGVQIYKIRCYEPNKTIIDIFLKFWTTVIDLTRKLWRLDPDVVFLRSQGIKCTIGVFYCKLKHKKMILQITSDDNIKLFQDRKNPFTTYNNRFIQKIIYHLYIYALNHADLIISQTKTQRRMLKKNFGLDCVTIPNSYPVPNEVPEKVKPPIISWIANFSERKRPELFIKLAKDCSKLNCRFIMAGDSSLYKNRDYCLNEIKKLKNLDYLDKISLEKSNEVIGKSSIFVNTSNLEGFPNTYLQAWMRETPVVALKIDVDGIIKKNHLGLVSETYEQLVDDVKYLIENENIRKKYGKNARKYAIEHFDIEKVAKKHDQLYTSLINH